EVTTKGLQYPLNREDLVFGKRIGTRNKAIENQIEIHFKTGNLFVFVNH
ncbi:MAG: thiamine diphosphokinase, partial [Polaribacter sp.]